MFSPKHSAADCSQQQASWESSSKNRRPVSANTYLLKTETQKVFVHLICTSKIVAIHKGMYCHYKASAVLSILIIITDNTNPSLGHIIKRCGGSNLSFMLCRLCLKRVDVVRLVRKNQSRAYLCYILRGNSPRLD